MFKIIPSFELNLWHALDDNADVPQEIRERARWCLFEWKHFRHEVGTESDADKWIIGLGAKPGDIVLFRCRIPDQGEQA